MRKEEAVLDRNCQDKIVFKKFRSCQGRQKKCTNVLLLRRIFATAELHGVIDKGTRFGASELSVGFTKHCKASY